jgi:hypothetical protein
MRTFPWLLSLGLALFTASLVFGSACQNRQSAVQQVEYVPTATVKDLMLTLIDPSADVVWEAVTTVVTSSGIVETIPRTEEDWMKARGGALRLVEATNLLMVPGRHVARPGEKSEAPGVELEPHEMEELISKDIPGWVTRAKGLREAGLEALQAIDARDPEKLFEVGERIELACENCHSNYWYPNQVLPPGYGPAAQ